MIADIVTIIHVLVMYSTKLGMWQLAKKDNEPLIENEDGELVLPEMFNKTLYLPFALMGIDTLSLIASLVIVVHVAPKEINMYGLVIGLSALTSALMLNILYFMKYIKDVSRYLFNNE